MPFVAHFNTHAPHRQLPELDCYCPPPTQRNTSQSRRRKQREHDSKANRIINERNVAHKKQLIFRFRENTPAALAAAASSTPTGTGEHSNAYLRCARHNCHKSCPTPVRSPTGVRQTKEHHNTSGAERPQRHDVTRLHYAKLYRATPYNVRPM